ncbi:hypothetical protein ACLSZ3_03480 [Avibacterium gallinarum]|nr:hypothetical protein [Avibacterium endocarditidis]
MHSQTPSTKREYDSKLCEKMTALFIFSGKRLRNVKNSLISILNVVSITALKAECLNRIQAMTKFYSLIGIIINLVVVNTAGFWLANK